VVIEKTEAAIAKYKAIKSGMMHDLFARGIDLKTGKLRPRYEEAPELYKESELGWVPREWEVDTIEHVSNRIWVGLVTTMTTHYVDFGVPLIRNSNIKDSLIDSSDIIYLDNTFSEQNKQRYLHSGDIATVHTGDIGTSAIIAKNLDPCHGFATINTTVNPKRIVNSYLCDYFNTSIFKNRIEAYATGDGRSNFNLYDYLFIDIPFPTSIEEQEQIATKIASIRTLINDENCNLVKTQQLKAGLMSDLLTGKVRVKYQEEKAEAV
jgi:type I restriction enzyme S subunit